ncbi:fungal-specific transcription factor domain-containing protein [Schizophyllum commune]
MEPEERARTKKRRMRGACDNCKKRKSDSSKMPNNQCSTCTQLKVECTHAEMTKSLGSAKSYVETLERRLKVLERLFRKYLPGLDLNHEVDKAIAIEDDESEDEALLRNDDDSPEARLISKLDKLQLAPDERVFFGKSSAVMLIKAALDIKHQYHIQSGAEPPDSVYARPKIRSEFLYPRTWQLRAQDAAGSTLGTGTLGLNFRFPEADLLDKLAELYFEHINLYFPLLHRPTFIRLIEEGTYLRDRHFAYVLLLVLGLGSRYSDDPRVLVDGTNDLHSAGWKYVSQVTQIRPAMAVRPSLYEVQAYCLLTLWIDGSSMPMGTWTEIGVGLRRAMEVGAHRRKHGKPTRQLELWKRAFWVLLCQDVYLSALYGQSVTLSTDMYDQDLCAPVDDEYWETGNPETCFVQPEGKPSKVEYFNEYIKLMEIYVTAMRSIYYTRKPTLTTACPTDQQTVTMLDSALNSWSNGLPPHLKWNPKEKDRITFEHAACLYTTYLHLQIFVHKPFITPLNARSKLNFPSLAICTSAARACARVMDARSQRDAVALPQFHIPVAIAGFILVLNLWTGKHASLQPNPKDLDDVYKCMRMLRACEERWHSAGRQYDCLRHLANAAEVGMPTWEVYENANKKRKRVFEEGVGVGAAGSSQDGSPATTNSSLEVVTPQTTSALQAAAAVAGPVASPEPPSIADGAGMLDFGMDYNQQFPADASLLDGLSGSTFSTATLSSAPQSQFGSDALAGIDFGLGANSHSLSSNSLSSGLDSLASSVNGASPDGATALQGTSGSSSLAPYDNFQFSFNMPAPPGLNMLMWNSMSLEMGNEDSWTQLLSGLQSLTPVRREDDDGGNT